MHELEPFSNWRHFYTSEEDENSPFFGKEHSEFEYSQSVYNYYIHPQWDEIGSHTLYLKILYVDYEQSFCIIELIGEWNDAIENDIMTLKRNIIDTLLADKIYKFILIAENVMNFHSSDDSYYEEWQEEILEFGGWLVFLNMPEHAASEMRMERIDHYAYFLDYEKWRTHQPEHLFHMVDNQILRMLD